MAIFGWETLMQAEGYARQADQQRLADGAMHLLMPRAPEQNDDEFGPLSDGAEKWAKSDL